MLQTMERSVEMQVVTFSITPTPNRLRASIFFAGKGGLNWMSPDLSTAKGTVTTTCAYHIDTHTHTHIHTHTHTYIHTYIHTRRDRRAVVKWTRQDNTYFS